MTSLYPESSSARAPRALRPQAREKTGAMCRGSQRITYERSRRAIASLRHASDLSSAEFCWACVITHAVGQKALQVEPTGVKICNSSVLFNDPSESGHPAMPNSHHSSRKSTVIAWSKQHFTLLAATHAFAYHTTHWPGDQYNADEGICANPHWLCLSCGAALQVWCGHSTPSSRPPCHACRHGVGSTGQKARCPPPPHNCSAGSVSWGARAMHSLHAPPSAAVVSSRCLTNKLYIVVRGTWEAACWEVSSPHG